MASVSVPAFAAAFLFCAVPELTRRCRDRRVRSIAAADRYRSIAVEGTFRHKNRISGASIGVVRATLLTRR
jgi:hypothetical protein